ncbi:Tn3 family transposase [Serratia proteamaculans]|uniref:Tn3 family transposase n=1 Tax=Serratia proteamaculans TaxID=28151 RepID=UPI003CFC77D7
MPRRSILSAAERESLLALPDTKDELIRHYTFSESDLSIIRQRRGPANRLGFAVQLCYLRFPGVILGADEPPFPPLLRLVANQLKVGIESWDEYGQREQTRREHLVELQTVFGFQPFTIGHYRQAVQLLTELAMQTDKGIVLARALIEHLRRQSVIVPALNAVERASAEAITRANRRLYDALAEPLTDVHRRRLDDLLKRRDNGKTTWLAWLRQSPVKPNSRHMLEHIERLKAWQALDLPSGIERLVHQNRLLKIAREGGQMTPADLAKFEPQRRYATLVALAIEGMATVTDEIIDLHDRILGKLFNAAKNKHQQQFQASGKAINAKVRLFGRIGQALIEVLRSMNSDNARKVPTDAPTEFIKPRWQKLVMTDTGIDRRYYELCALSELKNALRSGDIWVQGSRQFKDFEDYLVPPAKFASLKQASELPLAVATDCDQYLHDRLTLLETQLATVNRMALANELPDAIITESGLKITPLDAAVPDTAQALIDQTAMILPHVKITELLLEVDEWTGFTRHFAHLKSGDLAKDKNLLLTTILADAINLGLTKMAESCPGTTYAKLAWLQAWHIRDETYGAALAELVNAQFRHPFAEHWGDGTTSSSDGQNFRTGSKAESTGHINPKYGSSPGRTFYTHISDQYAPFHTKVVNVGVRDSTYVLDGLLYHESDLRIEEHYTDTAGFTDHVFALMHLLGFRFAPRIRDLGDTKLYIPKGDATYEALKPMIGGTLNIKHVRAHWDEILRMATSIKQGTATASLMLRKLGSYPRQNGLAVALRELGRIERTLFILDWLQSVELRRRVHAGLNKGEARNALARAVFFNRLGEIRDRSFEQQRYRASGLNLVTAAIVLWNTVYLERAANALRGHGQAVDDGLLQYLSPLGWEHINLTGDYLWRSSAKIGAGKFRPLRPLQPA